jgi:nucleotide-binding universal stress UspA family protein
MYKRILVPTDGSDTANAGLREALELVKEQGAQLRIVHVVDELMVVSPELYGSVYDRISEELRDAGRAVLDRAQSLARDAGIAAETQLIEAMGGPAGERVVKAAADWPADLIVCGTHGRRGLRRIVLGSDAEYIVRHSTVPILLIRVNRASAKA